MRGGVTVLSALFVILCLSLVITVNANGPSNKPKTVVSGLLRNIVAQHKRRGRVQSDEASELPILTADNDRLVVDVLTKSKADRAHAEAELKKMGMTITGSTSNVISGLMPIANIDSLETIECVALVQPALAKTRKGSSRTKGLEAMRLPLSVNGKELNGTGVAVGVLSDSFNRLGGAQSGIATGDLPSNVIVFQEGPSGADEGRAMIEIIHDIAPAARFVYATAFSGNAGFAGNILSLAGCPPGSPAGCTPSPVKCDVIVDDVGYFGEPAFSDGVIAQAVDIVAQAGVTYLSSMGNAGADAWQDTFRAGQTIPSDRFEGEFYGGTAYNARHGSPSGASEYNFIPFDVNAGEAVMINMYWQQPSRSALGGVGGSQNDLDIYALADTDNDGTPDTVIGVAAEANGVSGEPYEVLVFTPDQTMRVYLLIMYYTGTSAEGNLIRLLSSYGGAFVKGLGTNAPTGWGHPNAEGAIGVAAADYYDTPAWCSLVPLPESFTSLSGTPILFDKNGNATYILRERPDITAPDGAQNTFFGFPTSDGFLFFGTSAAAPHAAAVVALMKQARPSLTPAQAREALRTGAEDMDDPHEPGFQSGFDFTTGAGLVNAYNAIVASQSFSPTGPLPSAPPTPPGCVIVEPVDI